MNADFLSSAQSMLFCLLEVAIGELQESIAKATVILSFRNYSGSHSRSLI